MQKSLILLLVFALILQTSVSTINFKGIEQKLEKVNVQGFLEGLFEGLESSYPGLQQCLNEVVDEGSKLLPEIKQFIILLFKPVSTEDLQAIENVGYGVKALQAAIAECKSADQSEINQIKEFLESLKNPIEVAYKAGKELFIYQNSFAHFAWAGERSAESGDLKGLGLQVGMILNQLFLNQTSIDQLQNQMNQFITMNQVQQDFKQSAEQFLEGLLQGLSTNAQANTVIEVFPCILTETVAQLQNIFYDFQQSYINTTSYNQVPKVAKASIIEVGKAFGTLPDEMLSCGIETQQVGAVVNFAELIKLGQFHKVLFDNLKHNGGKALKLQFQMIQKLVHHDFKGFGQIYGQMIALICLENEQISISKPQFNLKSLIQKHMKSLEQDMQSEGEKISADFKNIENKIIKKVDQIMDKKNE